MADKEICFVILPFSKEFDIVWEGIRRAAKHFHSLKVLRSNTQASGTPLFQEIVDKISKSVLVIADFSLVPASSWPYPNVMTEAGIALGCAKEPYLISNTPIQELPAGWNSYRINTYADKPKNIEDLELWFIDYLEKLLEQNNLSTERAIQQRKTQPQKLNWLIQVVQDLREKASETYQEESRLWAVSRILFNPYGCFFTLTHQIPSSPEARAAFVEIQCGVHFYSWTRRKTPFSVCTRWLDLNKQEVGRTEEPILLRDSFETVTVEQIWFDFEEKLDQLLDLETPNFSKLTPLARQLRDLEKLVEELRKLEFPEVVRKQESKATWGINGYRFPYSLQDDSEISLVIDFRYWEEKNWPYWICFKPEGKVIEIMNWFKEVPFGDGLTWYIRVPVTGNQVEDTVRGYQTILAELIKRYKPQKTVSNTSRLHSENWNVQNWAKEALSKIGPEHEFESPPPAQPTPSVSDTHTRKISSVKLNSAVPTLVEGLTDDEWIVRREAAESLGQMGLGAQDAIPELIKALTDENKDVRKKVAWAIGKIGAESTEAALALVETMKDTNSDVRYWAAWALGELGGKTKGALPKLIEALKDENSDVREKAGLVIGKMGQDAKSAVSALIEAMKDENEEVLKKAAWAIGQIGPDPKEIIPALIEVMKSENWKARYEAAGAMARMGSTAKDAVPVLMEALQDKNEDVRKKAALALGEIGQEAKDAIGALIQTLKDEDYSVRYISAEALKKIKGKEYLKL